MRMNPQADLHGDARLDEEQTVTNVMSPSAAAARRQKPARAKRCASCQQVFSGEARFCPFDGDALDDIADWNPSDDPMIGQVIDGRYEVAAVLGEGRRLSGRAPAAAAQKQKATANRGFSGSNR